MRHTEGTYEDDRAEYSKPEYTGEMVMCPDYKGTGKDKKGKHCKECGGNGEVWVKTGAM